MSSSFAEAAMNNVGTSYILWALGLMGFAGLHRLYNRKFFTGFLWLFTGGLLGIGQIVDVFLIPRMVNEHNAWLMFRRTFHPRCQEAVEGNFASQTAVPSSTRTDDPATPFSADASSESERCDRLMLKLLKAAEARNGQLSVTQGVIDTGHSFSEVEATLRDMVKTGYIVAQNDPVSGIVVFDFIELSESPSGVSSASDAVTPRYT